MKIIILFVEFFLKPDERPYATRVDLIATRSYVWILDHSVHDQFEVDRLEIYITILIWVAKFNKFNIWEI